MTPEVAQAAGLADSKLVSRFAAALPSEKTSR